MNQKKKDHPVAIVVHSSQGSQFPCPFGTERYSILIRGRRYENQAYEYSEPLLHRQKRPLSDVIINCVPIGNSHPIKLWIEKDHPVTIVVHSSQGSKFPCPFEQYRYSILIRGRRYENQAYEYSEPLLHRQKRPLSDVIINCVPIGNRHPIKLWIEYFPIVAPSSQGIQILCPLETNGPSIPITGERYENQGYESSEPLLQCLQRHLSDVIINCAPIGKGSSN